MKIFKKTEKYLKRLNEDWTDSLICKVYSRTGCQGPSQGNGGLSCGMERGSTALRSTLRSSQCSQWFSVVLSGSQWFSVVRCSASVALLHPSPSRSQVTTGQENVTYNWSCCYFTCMFSSTVLIWTYILGGKLVQLAFSGLPTPKL